MFLVGSFRRGLARSPAASTANSSPPAECCATANLPRRSNWRLEAHATASWARQNGLSGMRATSASGRNTHTQHHRARNRTHCHSLLPTLHCILCLLMMWSIHRSISHRRARIQGYHNLAHCDPISFQYHHRWCRFSCCFHPRNLSPLSTARTPSAPRFTKRSAS